MNINEKIYNYIMHNVDRLTTIAYNFDGVNSAEDKIKYLKEIIFVLENETRQFIDLKKEFEEAIDKQTNL